MTEFELRSERALWTIVPFLRRRLLDPDSGVVIEVDRGVMAGRIADVLARASEIRRLPAPKVAYYVVGADEATRWPGLLYRRTGLATTLVARCETVTLAARIADLLNRVQSQTARDSVGNRFTSPF